MLDPTLRSAAVLACKYLILKACEGFSASLAVTIRDFAVETGPFLRRPESLRNFVSNTCDEIGRIVFGKAHVHAVLYGDGTDKRLIETIDVLLKTLMREIAVPLDALVRPENSEVDIRPRIHALGKRAEELHEELQQLLLEAQARFAQANIDHLRCFAADWMVREPPVEADWTVVSVDKVAYSKGALALESIAGARALFDHNRRILDLFRGAITEAG